MKSELIGSALVAVFVALSLAIAAPTQAQDEESAAESATESTDEEESSSFFDDIREGVANLADGAVASVPDVPSGAVIAFNRDECPLGWSRFPPADGRVIIGLSADEDNGPDQLLSISEPSRVRESHTDDGSVNASFFLRIVL